MSQTLFLSFNEPLPGLDGRTVGDFWQWAYSDILSNRNRSIFEEFIVGVALGVVDKPRIEWDATDLSYRGFKIEVKSSADCQSWHLKRLHNRSKSLLFQQFMLIQAHLFVVLYHNW